VTEPASGAREDALLARVVDIIVAARGHVARGTTGFPPYLTLAENNAQILAAR
jgi:hypothetical protein